MLNCVYKVPALIPVPPFFGSSLKIAWLFVAYNGELTFVNAQLAAL